MLHFADVAYVMTLLVICIYIFAILGNSIFGDDCPQNFGTVERSKKSNAIHTCIANFFLQQCFRYLCVSLKTAG